MIYHTYKGKKYPVNEVIIHTSATPAKWATGKDIKRIVAEITSWHKARGFSTIGYHRVIDPFGNTGVGRSIWEAGEHVSGYNIGTVGICLIPSVQDHNGIREFNDYFTEAQREALKSYIKDLKEYTTITKVSGHNEYSSKECPGFLVKDSDWL